MDQLTQEIKDKLQKVCICRGITVATLKASIRNGNTTLEALKKDTGVAEGGCKGRRCKDKANELIEAYKQGEWQ